MSNFKVQGELSLDGSKWAAGLNRAQSSVNNFASNVTSRLAAVFTVGAVAGIAKSTIAWASGLRDVSDALGVNVEWLQKMANGASLVGGNIEDISKFLGEMNKSREDALNNPGGKNAAALGRLGFSSSDISGLSTQAFFDRIVKQFANGATTQLSNDVQEVGGKSARNLLAAFANQFQSDIPILNEAILNQLDDIGDSFTATLTKMKVGLGPFIVDAFKLFDGITNFLKEVAAFYAGFIYSVTHAEWSKVNSIDSMAELFKVAMDKGAEKAGSVSGAAVNESDAINLANKAAAAARKRRENSPPLFETTAPNLSKGAGEKPYSDSLLRVGNFLGQGSTANMASIATRTAVATESMNDRLEKIGADIAKMVAVGAYGITD